MRDGQPSAADADIARLLETEQGVAEHIREAERQADRVVGEAEAEAARRLAAVLAGHEEAERDLAERLKVRRARDLADLEAAARERVRRYGEVPLEQIRDAAAFVVSAVIKS